MKNEAEKKVDKLKADIKAGKRVSPLKILRANCVECSGYSELEVRLCTAKDCICYKFRFGRNPVKRVMSEKQRANLTRLHASQGGAKTKI